MQELKFYLITDTHYFKPELGCRGPEYEKFMDFEQKCFAETSAINKAAFRYLEEAKDADIVLIAGDLTFNGEKESHYEFVKMLEKLRDTGKKIYVVTAGHDRNEHPFSFDENGRGEPEGTRFDELFDIYHEFGYDDAIAFDREHMSYVAQLSEDVRLLVLCNDTTAKRGAAYDDSLMQWAEEQCRKARADGQFMFAMEHYPLLPGQPVFALVDDATQPNGKAVADMLADNGVHLIFTGHMHNQSVNYYKSDKGNGIYDVCTGSVIGSPAFMRLVTLKDEKTAEITSIPVPEFEWDKKGLTGEQYLRRQYDSMIRCMLTSMENNPERFMAKIGIHQASLKKPIQFVGGILNKVTLRQLARFFFIKVDGSIADDKFADLATDIVYYLLAGDQPFTEGTPKGDFLLALFGRLRPLFGKLQKKMHDNWGQPVDLYDILRNTIGNYDISDYNCTLSLC